MHKQWMNRLGEMWRQKRNQIVKEKEAVADTPKKYCIVTNRLCRFFSLPSILRAQIMQRNMDYVEIIYSSFVSWKCKSQNLCDMRFFFLSTTRYVRGKEKLQSNWYQMNYYSMYQTSIDMICVFLFYISMSLGTFRIRHNFPFEKKYS